MIGDAKTRNPCTTAETAETAESSSGTAELAEERRFNRPTAYKASTISYSFPGDPVIPDAKVFMKGMKGKVGLATPYYTLYVTIQQISVRVLCHHPQPTHCH